MHIMHYLPILLKCLNHAATDATAMEFFNNYSFARDPPLIWSKHTLLTSIGHTITSYQMSFAKKDSTFKNMFCFKHFPISCHRIFLKRGYAHFTTLQTDIAHM